MDPRDVNQDDQSFRELLKSKLSDPNIDAILIGENHGTSFTPAAILANIDVLENAGRNVIYVAEELEQHANQSPQAMQSALVAQDIRFTDANLYQTLNRHGITVLGGENAQSSPLYGLTGKEREAQGLNPETNKMMSGMQRIAGGNEAFSDVINQAIKQNPGAVVVFVGGATHPAALEKNGVTDPGMQGRVPNSVTINLVKSMNKSDIVKQNAGYRESGGDGKGVYNYQVESSKENSYKHAFDAQKTPQAKFQQLSSMTNDLVKSYAAYYKSGGASLKDNAKLITEAYKASNHLPANAKFENFEKQIAKLAESGGDKPNAKIKIGDNIQKELDNALKSDIKKMNPELYKNLENKQEKKVSTSAIMGKLGGRKISLLDKARNALSGKRKEPVEPAAAPVKHDVGMAAEPVKPAAVTNESKNEEVVSSAVSIRRPH